MSESDDKYRVYLEAGSGQDLSGPRPMDDPPFCLGVLGDFSGRGTGEGAGQSRDWASRPPLRVTPENVLDFGGLSPVAEVRGFPGRTSTLSVAFQSMDDFHPDRLFQRLDVFEGARSARRRMVAGEGEVGGEGKPKEERRDAGHAGEVGLLDAILEETDEELLRDGSDLEGDLDAFIRRVVRPHAVRPGPDRSGEVDELDREVGIRMRAIMHSPGFQDLESLWRSVVFLLSRVETSSKLRVYLVDVSREELASDLLSTDEPTEWKLARTMLDPISDKGEEIRWAALLGAYDFGRDPYDVPLLQRIALLSEVADVPWISAGDPVLAGCGSLLETPDPRDWKEPVDDLWDPLRSAPEAGWVGLATPGFLLRTPYGAGGARTKTFAFHEDPVHPSGYLWGNPAMLWGVLCGQAFGRAGWGLRLDGSSAVGDLPMYLTPAGWGHSLEFALSHSASSGLAESGLMPLVGSRDEPEVRFLRVGSISREGGGLRAWWRD